MEHPKCVYKQTEHGERDMRISLFLLCTPLLICQIILFRKLKGCLHLNVPFLDFMVLFLDVHSTTMRKTFEMSQSWHERTRIDLD